MSKELLDKIYTAKETASKETFHENLNVYRQNMSAQLRAQDDMVSLCEQLRTVVRQNAVLILVNGEEAAKFVEEAKKFDCFSVNPEEFYEKIVEQISTEVYLQKTSNVGLFDVASAYLEDMAHDIGILEYPALVFDNKYSRQLNSKEDAVQVIKEAINNQVGVEFVGMYMVHQIANQIIDRKFDGKVFPAVGIVKDMVFAKDLEKLSDLGIKTFLVNAGKAKKAEKEGSVESLKEVTEENVKATLLKIKQLL